MIKIGITGQAGFVGTHLFQECKLFPEEFECIPFRDDFFQSEHLLQEFVKQCDVIVHLAAMNRHPEPQVIYDTNILLVRQLIRALETTESRPHILFSSSTQEELDNLYGKSKHEGRKLLEEWAVQNNAAFTGLIVPNVYGPFGRPNYNSFVATFCHKLTHGEQPEILTDSKVRLIYVGSLCKHIIEKVKEQYYASSKRSARCDVPYDFERKVSDILFSLENFKSLYFDQGFIPVLPTKDDVNLFNTFRSYIENDKHFPVKLTQHSDERGIFVETIKLGIGGQVSFSTTKPGITRGNHYHTRKIERFTVIKGEAKIELRKIGTDEIVTFLLNGSEPSYVDMPIWYTQFWINEWYNPEDGDTYFEKV